MSCDYNSVLESEYQLVGRQCKACPAESPFSFGYAEITCDSCESLEGNIVNSERLDQYMYYVACPPEEPEPDPIDETGEEGGIDGETGGDINNGSGSNNGGSTEGGTDNGTNTGGEDGTTDNGNTDGSDETTDPTDLTDGETETDGDGLTPPDTTDPQTPTGEDGQELTEINDDDEIASNISIKTWIVLGALFIFFFLASFVAYKVWQHYRTKSRIEQQLASSARSGASSDRRHLRKSKSRKSPTETETEGNDIEGANISSKKHRKSRTKRNHNNGPHQAIPMDSLPTDRDMQDMNKKKRRAAKDFDGKTFDSNSQLTVKPYHHTANNPVPPSGEVSSLSVFSEKIPIKLMSSARTIDNKSQEVIADGANLAAPLESIAHLQTERQGMGDATGYSSSIGPGNNPVS